MASLQELRHFERFRVAKRVVMYHMSPITNLRKILSEGLIPDPKRKESADGGHGTMSVGYDEVDYESYFGTYLAYKPLVAYDALRLTNKHLAGGVIVVVQVETKSMVLDEDEVVSSIDDFTKLLKELLPGDKIVRSMFSRHGDRSEAIRFYVTVRKSRKWQTVLADKFYDRVMSKFGRKVSQETQEKMKESVVKVLKPAILAHIRRQAAWALTEMLKESRIDLDRDPLDQDILQQESEEAANKCLAFLEKEGVDFKELLPAKDVERDMRAAYDVVTRKLKHVMYGGERTTARVLDRINFKGANKILAIVSYEFDEARECAQFTVNYGKGKAKEAYEELSEMVGFDGMVECKESPNG